MQILAGEGLLSYSENRGYRLSRVTSGEISATYEVRATLEGLACRLFAENRPGAQMMEALERELNAADALIAGYDAHFEDTDWSGLNERFHGCIVEGAGNPTLAQALKHTTGTPLAVLSSTVILPKAETLGLIKIAHDMHGRIFKALERGETLRAEGLMREHIYMARDLVLENLSRSEAGKA